MATPAGCPNTWLKRLTGWWVDGCYFIFEPCDCHIMKGLLLEISEILRARDCGFMWVRMTMKVQHDTGSCTSWVSSGTAGSFPALLRARFASHVHFPVKGQLSNHESCKQK